LRVKDLLAWGSGRVRELVVVFDADMQVVGAEG
jgi:hypothetical protein